MPALEKNRIYRAHIDGYSSEGLGIARIDGQVVFVHGAVRGETCDVLVMKVLKNAAFGKIAALAEPSPARRQPDGAKGGKRLYWGSGLLSGSRHYPCRSHGRRSRRRRRR